MLDLLDSAAVLGEEVDAGRLAAATARSADDVRAGLDTAVRAGVLTAVPDAPGRRRFAHAIVRDAIYADLSPSTREELHRRAAEALERFTADDDAGAGVVAGHWLRATCEPGALRRAASWARRAAAAATRSLAFDEAARFLADGAATPATAAASAGERAELLLELATAEFRAGRFGGEPASTPPPASDGRSGVRAARPARRLRRSSVHDIAAPELPAGGAPHVRAGAGGPVAASRAARPAARAIRLGRWPTPGGSVPPRRTRPRPWSWRRAVATRRR